MSSPRLIPAIPTSTATPHLFALLAVGVLAGFSAGLVRITSSLFAVELHADATELGLVSASQSLGLVVMSLPSGQLVHRHGPARIFAIASLGAGLVYLLVPAFPSIPMLVIASLIAGCGMPMRFVATNLAVMQRIELDGGVSAGWFRGCHLTSMFLIGPAVAVPVIAHGGYSIAWSVVAVSFFLAMVIAPHILRGIRDRGSRHSLSTAGILRLVASDAPIRSLAIAESFAQGTWTAFSFFIVAVAMQDFACTASVATALVSLQATVFILTFFLLGGRIRHWPRTWFLAIAFGSTVLGLLAVGVTRHEAGLWIGSVALGLGLGLIQLDHLFRSTTLGDRVGMSALAGIMSLAGSSGGLAAGIAGGVIGQLIGTQALFTLLVPWFVWIGWQQWTLATASATDSDSTTTHDSSAEAATIAVGD